MRKNIYVKPEDVQTWIDAEAIAWWNRESMSDVIARLLKGYVAQRPSIVAKVKRLRIPKSG